jgi:hypothetical protein
MEELEKEAIKQSFEVVEKFLNKIVPIEQLGGLLSDQIGYLRLKNLVKIIKKTEKLLNKNNIQPKDIKLKILLPLLNYSSLEEDENLQDKWANLLTNALDPERSKYIMPIYFEILKDLTPIEANLLDFLYNKIMGMPEDLKQPDRVTYLFIIKEDIMQGFNLTEEDYNVYLDNLIRLNLCSDPRFDLNIGPKIPNSIKLTKLGISFIGSCKI